MTLSTVYASSGLLPDVVEEVSLAPGEDHGWEVALVHRSARSECFDFTGGADPRSWLGFVLTQQHGFEEAAALEVARRLFEPFLPPSATPSQGAEPYGMAAR